MVTTLLGTAAKARERGDTRRARALLRTLAAQAPGDWQVWQALADVAETDAERVEALQRLAALAEPPGPSITRPLPEIHGPQALPPLPPPPVRLSPAAPLNVPTPSPAADTTWEAPRTAPTNDETLPPGWFRSHWLTYAAIGVIALLLIGLVLLARERLPALRAQPTPTPPLPSAGASLPTAAPLPTLPTALPAATLPPDGGSGTSTSAPLPTLPLASPIATVPTAPPPATAAPQAALAPGQVVQDGTWSVTVLRPEHLVLLNGSIGPNAPRGRFVLALLAVSNGGPAPASLPSERIALVDSRGVRYLPAPGMSSSYLATFQRGVRGDLSLEELIPAAAGIVSVPVIFDVPPDAGSLSLLIGDSPGGWAIGPQ
jgi:hypothetical protein